MSSSQWESLLDWHDGYSFNQPEVDDQHREFLAVAKRICQPDSGDGSFDLTAELSNLMQYASFHFFTEETLMRRVHYPTLEQHSAAHRGFEAKLMDFLSRMHPDATLTRETVAALVQSWTSKHLLVEDMELQRFLELLKS